MSASFCHARRCRDPQDPPGEPDPPSLARSSHRPHPWGQATPGGSTRAVPAGGNAGKGRADTNKGRADTNKAQASGFTPVDLGLSRVLGLVGADGFEPPTSAL
ncbi:hypothetical protein GCM10010372_65140 [Streptomyces tauricus]|nr:hypothetical protein GCM10010372_65140 [Streptomyces tauricus]